MLGILAIIKKMRTCNKRELDKYHNIFAPERRELWEIFSFGFVSEKTIEIGGNGPQGPNYRLFEAELLLRYELISCPPTSKLCSGLKERTYCTYINARMQAMCFMDQMFLGCLLPVICEQTAFL